MCRAVNPQTLQMLRIDRDGMIDDVVTTVTSFLMRSYCVFYVKRKHIVTQPSRKSKNARKRCHWHCNICFDWFISD